MSYATIDELAAAVHQRVAPENTSMLHACLDAAATEIDHTIDVAVVDPAWSDAQLALLNRVNLARAVQWWRANDEAAGAGGFAEISELQVPGGGFTRYRQALIPLKEQWGIA